MLAAQSCGCQDHSLELTKIVYTQPLSDVAEAVGLADRRLYSQEKYIRTIDIEKGKVTRTATTFKFRQMPNSMCLCTC